MCARAAPSIAFGILFVFPKRWPRPFDIDANSVEYFTPFQRITVLIFADSVHGPDEQIRRFEIFRNWRDRPGIERRRTDEAVHEHVVIPKRVPFYAAATTRPGFIGGVRVISRWTRRDFRFAGHASKWIVSTRALVVWWTEFVSRSDTAIRSAFG